MLEESVTTMDKKYLHHIWTRIRPIHWGYFLAAFFIFLMISLLAQRSNDLTMLELKDKVHEVDKNNGDVEAALQDLRSFVHTHMNASTYKKGSNGAYPPIRLQYTLQRLQAAEQQRLQESSAKLYTEAQDYCEQQNPQGFSGSGRIPCIEKYVSERGQKVNVIPAALYQFDFVSPRWSPDLAGWTLLLSIISGLLFALRLGVGIWLQRASK
jgi:hypothetical protein